MGCSEKSKTPNPVRQTPGLGKNLPVPQTASEESLRKIAESKIIQVTGKYNASEVKQTKLRFYPAKKQKKVLASDSAGQIQLSTQAGMLNLELLSNKTRLTRFSLSMPSSSGVQDSIQLNTEDQSKGMVLTDFLLQAVPAGKQEQDKSESSEQKNPEKIFCKLMNSKSETVSVAISANEAVVFKNEDFELSLSAHQGLFQAKFASLGADDLFHADWKQNQFAMQISFQNRKNKQIQIQCSDQEEALKAETKSYDEATPDDQQPTSPESEISE